MNAKMKNISRSEVLTLKEQISYQDGQVVSKTLAQNSAVSITLFSLQRARRSAPTIGRYASVTCLTAGKSPLTERNICFTRGNPSSMPAGHPHAVYGQEAFKMLLVVEFKQSGFVSCHPKPIHRPYQCGF